MAMHGTKLRIGVPRNCGFKELVYWDRKPQTNETNFNGFCIDVFKAAIEALPFDVPYEFIPFGGTYNDLIYQVYLQNYDAAVGDITPTANRSLLSLED
ncbi:unnamed protein product [Ilex paraguariensis]|uniref:Uncharacterized protein n=1 Tax=Ilex paraguariensis TaxID=185542 RepID=A0ABC8TMQ8_9AQUA